MSAYKEFTDIRFTNADLLVAALNEMGYLAEAGCNLPLYGYHGDQRQERAHIVVRRQQLSSASNDLGFKWTGRDFIPIISEYDSRNILTQAWRTRLQATYSKLAVLQVLQKKGARLLESRKTDEGLIILKAEVLL